ncbi:MAG: polysaccharide deacetylase family protein [Lachnospirales bacterium]
MSRKSRRKNVKKLVCLFIVLIFVGFSAYLYFNFIKENETVAVFNSDEEIALDEAYTTVTNEDEIKENAIKLSSDLKNDIDKTVATAENVGVTFIKDNDIYYNELGEILVVMYHGLTDGVVSDDKYHRSIAGFKDDLITLYNNNYRLISLDEYLNNSFDLSAGMTPVLLTFDDGLSSAFSLEKTEGVLVPKKNCAVDILEEFYKIHNDFGKSAVFFINNKYEPFAGEGSIEERFNFLIENGYSIGNHSYSHADISTLSEENIIKEIGLNHNIVSDYGYNMYSFAYPYGAVPTSMDIKDVFNNEYDDKSYSYSLGFLAFLLDDFSSNPLSVNYHNYMIPRFRGTNNELLDLGYFLEYYDENPEHRYFSDGNTQVVTIPFEKYSELDVTSSLVTNKDILVVGEGY